MWAFVSVWGAHALAFVVVRVLPDPSAAALGFQGSQKAAKESFEQEHEARPYLQTLLDLARGNLGNTLDNVSVISEIREATLASGPRLLLAAAIVFFVMGIVVFVPEQALASVSYASGLISFFPPFLMPFLGLGILVSSSTLFAIPHSIWWLTAVCIAIPAAAFAGMQAADVMNQSLRSAFAVTIQAAGASRFQQRVRLSHNVIMEITPTLEKITSGLLTSLLFAEPILGESGLGTLATRAVRRTDIEMLLGLVLVFAVVVNLTRLMSISIRSVYGIRPR